MLQPGNFQQIICVFVVVCLSCPLQSVRTPCTANISICLCLTVGVNTDLKLKKTKQIRDTSFTITSNHRGPCSAWDDILSPTLPFPWFIQSSKLLIFIAESPLYITYNYAQLFSQRFILSIFDSRLWLWTPPYQLSAWLFRELHSTC